MITSIKQFKIFLEGFQAKPGEKFGDIPADRLKHFVNKGIDNVSTDSMATIAKDDKQSKPPKSIKAMPSFKRILYSDVNPSNIKGIDIEPLDIVYEMDIKDVQIYSNWLADKRMNTKTSNSEESEELSMKHIENGEAIYYGWNAGDQYLEPHYFVVITTTSLKGLPGYSFKNIHELRSAEEMYDIVWALIDAVDDVRKSGNEMLLNPDSATNGRLSDEVDYFN